MHKALAIYFRTSFEELKKVSWPTRTQVWQGTLLVVGMSAFVAIYLGALDYLLNYLLGLVV